MDMTASGRAQIRRILEWAIPPHLRLHVFRLAAYALPEQVGAQGFVRLASELSEAGRVRDLMLCWRILHRMAPADTRIAIQRISNALDVGDLAEVERAFVDSAEGAGIPPHCLIRFAGQLAKRGHIGDAGHMLVRLAENSDSGRLVDQSPSILSNGLPRDLGDFGRMIISEKEGPVPHLLVLARLCFTFRNPAVAVELFKKVSSSRPLEVIDRVGMLHAMTEASCAGPRVSRSELRDLKGDLSNNPDALSTLAKVAIVTGELDIAQDAISCALSAQYGNSHRMEGVAEDCVAILHVLAQLRNVDAKLPPMLLERVKTDEVGVPKVFLCGFGWSGSGALYDEIRSVPDFCEFEGAGLDAIINEDADSEVTFVQGSGGLGDLWKSALESGCISWHGLWDTFNLHVVGLSSIGYAQYKSSAAARNHVRRYAALYTGPFRRFLEGYAEIRRTPRPGALHECLLETTELLCTMLVQQSGGRAVLFNNAIFGRDAAMLEIFRSRRAAIVYRDPRDVYVDRRNNDLNHWRTPAQLAAFYTHGLRRYMKYKLERGGGDATLREVPFERFVKDDRFRARVRSWLLMGASDTSAIRYFDPAVSSENIDIHVGALTLSENEQLKAALEDSRILDRLSDNAWAAE